VLPVTSSPGATACVGGSITLSVSGSGYTYQWNKGGTPIGGQTGASLVLSSLSAASEADYSVVVTSIATSCSQETAKTSVKVYSVPVANFSFSSPQCTGTPVSFTDQSTADARGTLSFAWTFGDGNTSSSQNPTNAYAVGNSYSSNLSVSYSGISGCSNSISKPITINSSVVPSIQSTADPICVGDATTLSIAGTFNLIAWSGDNALSGSSSSVGITKPGNYSVNTTDENGCTASASIVINPKPIITPFSVTVDKPAIKLGDHVQLTATSGADSYSWTPVLNISDPTISNPTASPTLNTYYKVVAKKVGFCDASDSVMVSVDTGGGANINPPILFTPNGDTFNDVWKIPDTDSYPDCTMTVYDGHGSQMYQQKPYNSSNYWDGTYNGKLVPEGTYFYVFSCPTLKPATGTVLVVR
jgi:gliding motility-associated-like protein